MTNKEYADSLRQVADAVEKLDFVPELPDFSYYGTNDLTEVKQIIRLLGGEWRKGPLGTLFIFSRMFGFAKLKIVLTRGVVCRRVVKGEREVPEVVLPARTIPAHTEPIVEWECGESILAGGSEEAA